jgi:hypothetical protein
MLTGKSSMILPGHLLREKNRALLFNRVAFWQVPYGELSESAWKVEVVEKNA